MTGPLDRLLTDPGLAVVADRLGAELPSADVRSLLLEIAARRAAARSPKQVLEQYRTDRFCAPGPVDPVVLAEVTASLLRSLSDEFEPVGLSPLAPLGTSSLVSPVPQNNVVTTMRLHDVASDPTNALALEVAERRKDSAVRAVATRLCGLQRVVRAQRFDGPVSFAHFSLIGLVSAGRDRGDRAFEVGEIVRQVSAMASALEELEPALAVRAVVSDLSGRFDEARQIVDRLADHLPAELDTSARTAAATTGTFA